MTVESCATFCNPYQFFGLEYGRECYCGNTLNTNSGSTSASDCNMPCKGDSTQTCGGGQRLSVYKTVGWSPPVNEAINGYDYFGCYSELESGRTLSDDGTSSGGMTAQQCSAFCKGSAFFGLENGNECRKSPNFFCNQVKKTNANQTAARGSMMEVHLSPRVTALCCVQAT
jgi:hypothetical protein